MTPEDLRSHFADLTDEALQDVLATPRDYTPEALDAARVEAARRGISEASAKPPLARSEPSVVNDLTRAKGSRWLGVVGLLSLGNTVLSALGSKIVFVVGLGITQLADALFEDASPPLRVVAVAFGVVCAGIFFFLQYLARTSRSALLVGIWLYVADTLIIVAVRWWEGLAVHLILLLLMVRGLGSSEYQRQAAAPVEPSTM